MLVDRFIIAMNPNPANAKIFVNLKLHHYDALNAAVCTMGRCYHPGELFTDGGPRFHLPVITLGGVMTGKK